MSAIPIHFGIPWSPYFVFIKGTDIDDNQLLKALGLSTYVRIQSSDGRFDYLAVGRDAQWIHVADNFGYTHWHSSAFRDAISKLVATREVFSFSIGDADVSFDLHHYRAGKLLRRFVWESRHASGGQVQDQFGSPLDREEAIECGKDPIRGLWQVASQLGIQSDYAKIDLQLYAPMP